jgi:hypothetical protein
MRRACRGWPGSGGRYCRGLSPSGSGANVDITDFCRGGNLHARSHGLARRDGAHVIAKEKHCQKGGNDEADLGFGQAFPLITKSLNDAHGLSRLGFAKLIQTSSRSHGGLEMPLAPSGCSTPAFKRG